VELPRNVGSNMSLTRLVLKQGGDFQFLSQFLHATNSDKLSEAIFLGKMR
jgi:hypothetical protein